MLMLWVSGFEVVHISMVTVVGFSLQCSEVQVIKSATRFFRRTLSEALTVAINSGSGTSVGFFSCVV